MYYEHRTKNMFSFKNIMKEIMFYVSHFIQSTPFVKRKVFVKIHPINTLFCFLFLDMYLRPSASQMMVTVSFSWAGLLETITEGDMVHD